jgi:reverse gyrase
LADIPRLGLWTIEKTAAQWGKCHNCGGRCVEILVTDFIAVSCEVCLLDVKIKTSKEKSEVNGKLRSSKDRDPAVGT